MENSIRIDAGAIRLLINEDPNRVIQFDPNDVLFVEKFYYLLDELDVKQEEYLKKARLLEKDTELDDRGVLKNTIKRIELLKEVATYFRGKIDELFGEGTAQTAFGDALNLDMITQFLQGIMPHIESERAKKLEKYVVKD